LACVSTLLAFLVEAMAGAVVFAALPLFVASVTEALAMLIATFFVKSVASVSAVASFFLFAALVPEMSAVVVHMDDHAAVAAGDAHRLTTERRRRSGSRSKHEHGHGRDNPTLDSCHVKLSLWEKNYSVMYLNVEPLTGFFRKIRTVL
jgi:hypothetical protein